MTKCLNCGKDLKQKEGSREKKYCNDICRASYHQKKNKGKEPKYVKYSTFKELKDKLDALTTGQIKESNINKQAVKNITEETQTIRNIKTMPEGLDWKQQLEWKRNNKN